MTWLDSAQSQGEGMHDQGEPAPGPRPRRVRILAVTAAAVLLFLQKSPVTGAPAAEREYAPLELAGGPDCIGRGAQVLREKR